MKRALLISAFTTTLTMAAAAPAWADQAQATSKGCMACHSVDKKIVGPGYKEIAAKYAGQADAAAKLATKIMKGSTGAWGPVPMPANPQVKEDEAKQLAEWILSLK